MYYKRIPYKIEQSIKERGVFGTFIYILKLPRKKIINHIRWRKKLSARKKEIALDEKYGIDTVERVEWYDIQAESVNLKYAESYEATLWIDFDKMLAPFDLSYKEMTFIDLGAGKGRAVLIAASLPFDNITGVELSEKLADIAKENIKKFPKENVRCKQIDIICLDVVEYDFPKGGLVIYLFNPFEEPVMEQVIENLRKAYEADKRPVLVIYKHPLYEHLWKKEKFLHLVQEYMFEEYMNDMKLQVYASEHFRIS